MAAVLDTACSHRSNVVLIMEHRKGGGGEQGMYQGHNCIRVMAQVQAVSRINRRQGNSRPSGVTVWGQGLRIRRRSSLSLPKRLSSEHLSGGRHTGAVALFTGIVEEMGKVLRLDEEEVDGKVSWTLEVEAHETLKGTQLGDSIAINGTCLTVTTINDGTSSFTFGLAPETLRCTSLGDLQKGSAVNLERSLRPDSRMGGHFVQGHVDATGTILSFSPEGDSLWVKVQAPKDLMPYIVPKGYIAVDGTSLTVCDVNDEENVFTFMLVAYTQQNIVVPSKAVGSKVNLEVDILGKYVGRMLKTVKDDKTLQLKFSE